VDARAYYNEIDPAAADVLRELVSRNVIAPGDVDTRSIKDVQPGDLAGYTQCHFFAGGGLWSVAARLAGWPDNRNIWTGSCPCQGESLAGKRLGADDPRHLWPDFYRLIRAARPAIVMGEQVAAAAGTHWLDGVCADLALETYAARAVDIPACAVDAPHQRNRLYWLAVDNRRSQGRTVGSIAEIERGNIWGKGPPFAPADAGASRGGSRIQPNADGSGHSGRPEDKERQAEQRASAERPADVVFPDSEGQQRGAGLRQAGPKCDGAFVANRHGGLQPNADQSQLQGQSSAGQQPFDESDARALRNGSWWADAEWVVSPLDGKARRTKPGLPFLVDGLPGRVDLWRVGGNAISPILAAEVIAAFLETEALGDLT
jgi:DNA (cytosine-5)-methyltransferase 1